MCTYLFPTIATAHNHYFPKQHQSICLYAANWIVTQHLSDGYSGFFCAGKTGWNKNVSCYNCTPLHIFSHGAQARPLPTLYLANIIFSDSKFFTSSLHFSKYVHHTCEGVIPVKFQNGVIKYQFHLWPRNSLQMFTPSTNPELSVYKTPNCWLGSLLMYLRQTETDVLVKDSAELWDFVAWTLVIVWYVGLV